MFISVVAILFFGAFIAGWWGAHRHLKRKGSSGIKLVLMGPGAGAAASFGVIVMSSIIAAAFNIPLDAEAEQAAKPSPSPTAAQLTAEDLAMKKHLAQVREEEERQNETIAAKQALLERIKKLNSAVVSATASDSTKHLLIEHFRSAVWSERSMVVGASNDVMRIMEDLAKDEASDFEKVTIALYAPTKDKYGNESRDLAMRWSYDMTEMKKINWDKINSWDLMNFVQADFTPLGRRAAAKYCADENQQIYCRDFCLQVLQ